MSNIEEDIKVLTNIEKLIRIEFKHYLTDREMKAINNVLLEREQDKKRIQELEEENRIFALEGSKVRLSLYIKENYILKQKIKDKILELEQEDLEIYDTDSEDLFIAKYEQRAILDNLKDLLQESEDK